MLIQAKVSSNPGPTFNTSSWLHYHEAHVIKQGYKRLECDYGFLGFDRFESVGKLTIINHASLIRHLGQYWQATDRH